MPQTYIESCGRNRPRCSSAAVNTSPSAANATADGTTKNASLAEAGVDAPRSPRAAAGPASRALPRTSPAARRLRLRHPEQADRQRIEQLRVGQAGDGAGRQQARDYRVDVAGELHGAAADEDRHEVADRPDGPARSATRPPPPRDSANASRRLDRELEKAANHRSPGQGDRQRVEIVSPPEDDERGDHRRVPGDRRGIRQEEFAVAVEHAQTPR